MAEYQNQQLAHLPEIRLLVRQDMDQIVVVHSAAFPHSALTKLGSEAVRRYYEWQIIGPHDAVNIGAFTGDLLIGFCFGGIFRGALGGFLEHNRSFLVRRVMSHPWLLFNPLFRERAVFAVKRVFKRKRRPGVQPEPSATAVAARPFGILSIAVHPAHQGSGAAQLMMQFCEQAARDRGFTEMGLTVHPTNGRAVRFYEKIGWHRVPGGSDWTGSMRKPLDIASPHDRPLMDQRT